MKPIQGSILVSYIIVSLVGCSRIRNSVATRVSDVSPTAPPTMGKEVPPTAIVPKTISPAANRGIDMSEVNCDSRKVESIPFGPEVGVPMGLVAIRKGPDIDDAIVILDHRMNIYELAGTQEEQTRWIGLSPNGRMLAYAIALEEPILRISIFDSTLQERAVEVDLSDESFVKPGDPTSWGINNIRWINNRWLSADLYSREDPSGNTIRLAVIDSLEGIAIGMAPDLTPEPTPTSTIILSPDMERAFYATGEDDLALVNNNTGKVLWKREDSASLHMIRSGVGSFWASPAAWSTDGSMIAYTAHEELSPYLLQGDRVGVFLLSRDGEVHQPVTSFSSSGFDNYYSDGLVWSQDDSQLAFFAYYLTDSEGHYPPILMVYDNVSNQLKCVTRLIGEHPRFNSMVWSPDGRFISYAAETEHFIDEYWYTEDRWFIVDLSDGTTYEVDADIFQVAGWSEEFAAINK